MIKPALISVAASTLLQNGVTGQAGIVLMRLFREEVYLLLAQH